MNDYDDWIDVVKTKKTKNLLNKINNMTIKSDQKNLKKILCSNIISKNICSYGNNCLYAHSLSEQNIDDVRKIGYDIVTSTTDLSNIDLQNNTYIYNLLLFFTNICESCIKKKCTGGYNCKFGVCLKKYCICISDLNYGNCKFKCDLIHLSKRGLTPYYIKKKDFTKDFTNDYIEEKIKTEYILENTVNNNLEDNKKIKTYDSDTISDISDILTDDCDEYDESIFSK
jgi:hypothetical protein